MFSIYPSCNTPVDLMQLRKCSAGKPAMCEGCVMAGTLMSGKGIELGQVLSCGVLHEVGIIVLASKALL